MIEQIINTFASVTGGVLSAIGIGEKIQSIMTDDPKKAAVELGKLNHQLLSIQNDLLKSQQLVMELGLQNQKLAERINHLEQWEIEKDKFHLVDLSTGSFAYSLLTDGNEKNPPYYCANCFNSKKLSLLQFNGDSKLVGFKIYRVLCCNTCSGIALLDANDDIADHPELLSEVLKKNLS